MGSIEALLIVTAIAGVFGTGIGGIIGALLQKESKRTVSLLLSFAAGVMLSVVCFDLVVEAIETNAGIFTVIFAISMGVIITFLLNYIIDRKTSPEIAHIDESHPKTADDLDELIHSDHLEHHRDKNDNKLSLFVAGIVMACAIALHRRNDNRRIVCGRKYYPRRCFAYSGNSYRSAQHSRGYGGICSADYGWNEKVKSSFNYRVNGSSHNAWSAAWFLAW